jgi:hypothetical protein
MILVALMLFSGTPFGGPTPSRAAQGTSELELDIAATTAQTAAEQAADRKGVIWLPHAKWDTANGYDWAGIESDLQDMQRAHIGWIRIFLRQDLPMSFHDRLVPLIAQYGIQLLPIIKKTDPQEDLGTPAQQAAYRAWLTEVVTRYHSTVRYWEIENETNIPQGWAICCHNDPDPAVQAAYVRSVESYLTLLRMAHEIIKGIDPTLQVVIAGLCEAGAERYIEELIRLNAHQYFDIMSYHPFGTRPEAAVQRVNALKAKMALQPELAAKPIWITAIGYHAQAGWKAPGRVADEEVKADYLVQTMQLMHDTVGVEGPIFWYALSEPSLANGYGLIQIDERQTPPRKTYLPAYTAFQDLWVTEFMETSPAIADSFVSRNFPTANYGNSQQLRIGYGTDVREAYLKFDLTSLTGYTLLDTQLRFLTANTTDAGSAATQVIRMAANPNWTEGGIKYRNQPMPIVGTVSDTSQGKGYQITLDAATLQQAVGGQLVLTINSQSADELVIQSREWIKNPPKLIVSYTTAAAVASTEPDGVAPSAEELEPIEEVMDSPDKTVEDLYEWSVDDPYSGYPYEMLEETPEEIEEGEQGAATGAELYLPFVEQ